MDQNIELAIRIKPCDSFAISPTCGWDSESIQVIDRNIFTFDLVIDPEASQETVFDKVGMRIISNILEGYNGCIFAYGQTGSGKTYTMTGYQQNEGLVQKCLRKLWNCVRSSEFFEIKLGYFEIYNETIKDLLSNHENLTIREHVKTGFYIENLTEKIVEKYQDFQELMIQGISARTVKETKMNSTSSRSHSVLEVSLAYKRRENALMVLKHAKLTFIDLAGSQKQKETQVEGQRLKEAANINKSLSTLSLVISKLSQQSQRKSGSGQAQVHIPFRNSVLTKILKNSLTGKSKITIICTVSLQERFIDETVSTLRFAQMAKSIKMKINKNEEQFDGTKERLFEEFASVKQRMTELDESYKDLSKENEDLKRQNARIKDELEKKETELSELQISMECMRIESKQIIQEIKTSSQVPPQFGIGQSRPYSLSESQFPQNYSNYRSSQAHKTQLGRQNTQYANNQINFENLNPHQQSQFSSQLSFFKSHISSDGNSPKDSFFTIQQEDSRAENSGEDSKEKTQVRIKQLEIELQKFRVENEFLKFYRDLQESEIAELIKNSVFLKANEDEIEEATQLFKQLMHNKRFDHAQLKFLDACLKNSQKDKTALNLATQEKKQQKQRFNHTTEKIKNLLISYVENKATFQLGDQIIHQDFINRRGSQIFGSPDKRQSSQPKSFIQNTHEINYLPFNDDFGLGGSNQWCVEEKKQPKSFNKKKSMQVEDFSEVKASQTPPIKSSQKLSQIPFFEPRNTQGYNLSLFQSSQVPMLMMDSRSLRSQTSNKLSNNQLEYLKKDYEKMVRDVKDLREEIEKNKVLMMEKDGLLDEKTIELEEMRDKVKMLEEELETQKQLVEIERKISNEKMSKKIENGQNNREAINMLRDKEQELQCLRQFMSQTEANHTSQTNMLKLRIKELQLTVKNLSIEEEKLIKYNHNIVEQYEGRLKDMSEEVTKVKKEKQQIDIEFGVINSENAVLTEQYNYLKTCLKNNQNSQAGTPKKIYSKRSSFFSISQQSAPNIYTNRPQTQTLPTRPKQLTERQCIEVIENKTLQSMYQAAYHFYKKCFIIEDSKRSFQEKVIFLQEEINQLVQKQRAELQKMDHELVDAKKSALNHQEAVIDLKKEILDLKKELYDQQKLIDDLCSNEKRVKEYSHLLETKLKEKNQRQLQAKQKAHNLSAQLRDNSLTPNYAEKNNRFNFGKNRYTSDSGDSLVSNGDTPVVLNEMTGSRSRRLSSGSRKSVEEVRGKPGMDELEVLRSEIMEVENDMAHDSYADMTVKVKEGTESIVSHTVTNKNEENHTEESQHSFNLFSSNQNRSKAATTKGHFSLNIFSNNNKSKK